MVVALVVLMVALVVVLVVWVALVIPLVVVLVALVALVVGVILVLFLILVLDSCSCSCSCSWWWWWCSCVALSRLHCSSPTCPMACISLERLIARDAPMAHCEEGRRRGRVEDKGSARGRSHERDKGSPGATRPGGEPASCLPLCITPLPSSLSSFS